MGWSRLWWLSLPCLLQASCYSFKDASVDPNLKTFKVNYFDNRATLVNPVLSQQFTEALKEKIQSETSLDLVTSEPNVEFSGVFSRYDITPIASQGTESAALNRLSVTVDVQYTDHIDEKRSWKVPFTRFADFSRSASFNDVEDALVNEISESLIDDIFKRAFVNW